MRPVLRLIFIKIDNQIKINTMKRSELRQIIREEISAVLQERDVVLYRAKREHPWAVDGEDEFGYFKYSDELEKLAQRIADEKGGEVEGYGFNRDGEVMVATKGVDYIIDRQGNIKDEKPSFT